MNRGGTTIHSFQKHDSTVAQISSGSFAGDNSSNRAIPHGLGIIPKLVMLEREGGLLSILMFGTNFAITGNNIPIPCTAMDETNFYTGNSTSLNQIGSNYKWIAEA